MATVTGTAVDPSGVEINGGSLRFSLNPAVVAASGDDTLFPRDVTVEIGSAGQISFDLAEGSYTGTYQAASGYVAEFGFAVPAGATASFNSCIVPLFHES